MAFRPIDLQKGGRRSMRIQIFVNGFCWNDVLKKPPFLFCLIPSTLFVQNMYNIDFWHNWCLFAPFIQDCHCCLLYGLLWWNYTRWKEIPDGYFSIIINCLHAQLVATATHQTIVKQNSLDGVLYKNSTNPNLAWLKCNKVRRKSDHLEIP